MKRFVSWLLLILLGGVLGAAAVLAWPERGEQVAAGSGATKWTCSMHPQIVMDHKDICPLCGMDLTPIGESDDDPIHLTLSAYAQQMAGVATSEVRRRELFKEIRTVGRIEFDETRVAQIAARVNGRVEQVFANFPGTPVKAGEHLVSIYSPELLSTQEEYLAAHRREESQRKAGGQDLALRLSAAAKRRLELWGITETQIDQLTRTGAAQTHLVVYAPIGGTVIDKDIRAGQYVKEGDKLYTIADLTQVWLIVEIYESELSWVQFGQPVEVTLESEPNRPVTGRVAFIEPVVNDAKRTVQVRVILENAAGRFKPGMYTQALVRAAILPDGRPAPTGLEGKYVCPMHPYEVSEKPANCRVCGMPLERPVGSADVAHSARSPAPVLAVPAESVLTTGVRRLVYVEREPCRYQLVEPKLGPRAGDYYPVLAGLREGDRVVTRGSFLLDSQFQVTGKISLLYPNGVSGTLAAPNATGLSAKELADVEKLPEADRQAAKDQLICPVTGLKLGSMGMPFKMSINGRTVFLCCKGCEGKVKADPEAAFKKLEAANKQ